MSSSSRTTPEDGEEKANWIRIGAAFENKDGKGLNVQLSTLPHQRQAGAAASRAARRLKVALAMDRGRKAPIPVGASAIMKGDEPHAIEAINRAMTSNAYR